MEDVSVGRALGAGFGLIRRHPGAIAVWTVVYILLAVLPAYGVMAMMQPLYAQLAQNAASGHAGATSPAMLQSQMQMLQIEPAGWLLGLVCQALLLGAAYRAVLFPQERGFFYLRLGMRELWLGLTFLVLVILLLVAMFIVMLPMMIVAGIAAAATAGGSGSGVGAGVAVLFGFIALFGGLGVLFWMGLRLSLALPMSFAERRFRLFESWDRTRGLGWTLFGTAAVIVGLLLVGEVVIGMIGFLLTGPAAILKWLGSTAAPQEAFARVMPIMIGAGLVLAPLATLYFALFGGAWAQFYRDLTPATEDVFS